MVYLQEVRLEWRGGEERGEEAGEERKGGERGETEAREGERRNIIPYGLVKSDEVRHIVCVHQH